MNDKIDLRSDTLNVPTEKVRQFMTKAPVGDDVYGEDPSVNEFQNYIKNLSGKECVLLTPTCTQANLTATLTHCDRGDEYIAGETAHLHYWESGGTSVLGGIQSQTIPFNKDGSLDLDLVESKIKPKTPYFPKTKLLCLENTCEGRPLSLDYLKEAYALCQKHGLKLHVDGARIFNAIEYLNLSLKEVAQYCDSMSICFSKGLGAPIGSALCLSEKDRGRAMHLRKMLGGGMRQSGMLAAACQFVTEHHVHFLKKDRENAETLAKELRSLQLPFIYDVIQNTNMVFFHTDANYITPLTEHLKSHNIIIGGYIQAGRIRLVFHSDVKEAHISRILEGLQTFDYKTSSKTKAA